VREDPDAVERRAREEHPDLDERERQIPTQRKRMGPPLEEPEERAEPRGPEESPEPRARTPKKGILARRCKATMAFPTLASTIVASCRAHALQAAMCSSVR
jgi:hypothetical protein